MQKKTFNIKMMTIQEVEDLNSNITTNVTEICTNFYGLQYCTHCLDVYAEDFFENENLDQILLSWKI